MHADSWTEKSSIKKFINIVDSVAKMIFKTWLAAFVIEMLCNNQDATFSEASFEFAHKSEHLMTINHYILKNHRYYPFLSLDYTKYI